MSRLNCSPPLRAGLDIETLSNRHCATGAIGYDAKSSDDLPPSTALDYFILTAGHCAAGDAAHAVWYHGGQAIEQVVENYYDELAGTAREGSKCGFLTERGVDTTAPDGSSLISQRMAQIANVRPAVFESDSGSPVVKNTPNRAVGVVNQAVWAGGPSDRFVYSQIGFLNAYSNTAGSANDYRVLTSAGPGGGQGDARCTAMPGEPVKIPKRTTDESYSSYANCLTALGLVPARDTKAYIDAEITKLPDTVLSVSPAEGSSVPAGSTVTATTNPALGGTLKAASDALIANNPGAASGDPNFTSKTAPLVAQECLKLAAMSRTITEPNDRTDENGDMVDDKMPDEVCGNATTTALPIF